MVSRVSLSAFAVVLGLGCVLHASEEEFLPWKEVSIVFAERKETGKVVVSAKALDAKYREISIEAFGKRHSVGKDHLDKLTGFPLSSLVTTHEAGYERLGGHTIHFKLKMTRYDRNGALIEDRVTFSVSQGKGVVVSAPQQRVLPVAAPEKK